MPTTTIELRPFHVLTITADAESSGNVRRIAPSGSPTTYAATSVAVSTTATVGPFNNTRNYAITSDTGLLAYAMAESDDTEQNATLTGTTQVDDFAGFASNLTTVSSTQSKTVAANTQSILYGTLTVTGSLTIAGELHLGPWPF